MACPVRAWRLPQLPPAGVAAGQAEGSAEECFDWLAVVQAGAGAGQGRRQLLQGMRLAADQAPASHHAPLSRCNLARVASPAEKKPYTKSLEHL